MGMCDNDAGYPLHDPAFDEFPEDTFIEGGINCLDDLAKEFGYTAATVDVQKLIARAIYKGTSCGAWLEVEESGIKAGSIVEGVDQETSVQSLQYPFTKEQFWAAIKAVEDEAKEIWDETHGCDGCWEGCEDCGEKELGQYIPVNPNCKSCGGEGVII